MRRRDESSEDEIDIQYRQDVAPIASPQRIGSDNSENLPLSRNSPRKIIPSELHYSIGDKTTKLLYKKNIARKPLLEKQRN